MKNWSRTNKSEERKTKDFTGKDSITSAYKREILDTRIAVSEIAKETRIVTPHILDNKLELPGSFVFR